MVQALRLVRWPVALTFAVIACTDSGAAPPRPDLLRAVEATAARLRSLNASPGFGFAVVQDGRTLHAGGVGYANVEGSHPFSATTPFYIASTTKAFVGLASAILAERGSWNLDATLGEYMPLLALQPPLDASAITVRQLLTHTHGISNEGPVVTKLAYTGDYSGDDELILLLREHPAEPGGTSYSYGNIGYNVAALAMARVTGVSWKETVETLVFEPLGMRGTTAYASRVDTAVMARPYRSTAAGFERLPVMKRDATMQSAGGLFSTPADMGLWLEAQLGQGRIGDRQLLPPGTVAESQRTLVVLSQLRGRVRVVGYGLGWQIGVMGRDTILLHGGAFPGYATLVSFIPRRRAGVVVMANSTELGGVFADLATRAFYDVLSTGRPISNQSLRSIAERLDAARSPSRP